MTNMFMSQVQAARKFSFLHPFKYWNYRKSYKNFVKKIDRGSPSFGVLWHFADFIKYAELIFMYNNCKDSTLYSSQDYAPTQNGFKITFEEMVITIKLYSDTKKVGIDIVRSVGNRIKSNYTFENEQWTIEPDEYDEILLDRIIGLINSCMIFLLNWCITIKLNKLDESDFVDFDD